MTPCPPHDWQPQPVAEWLLGEGNWKCSKCGETRAPIPKPEGEA